jgi:pimeloyl-ACP methyl ester carboxylesterase
MIAALPNAKLVLIEECGHMAPLERPHATTAVMRYWLQ